MKDLRLRLIVIALISLSSCSSKDDDNMQNDTNFAELIVGQWLPTEMTINGTTSTNPCDFAIAYRFSDNASFGEGIIDGNVCVFAGNNGGYTIEGSIVTIISARHESEIEILSLNEDEFVFSEKRLWGGETDLEIRMVTCQKIID